MIDQKTSLKNSLWSITDNFSQQILSFLIFTILARWLSPQEFGLLAIAHLMVQFVRLAVLDALALPVLRGRRSWICACSPGCSRSASASRCCARR